MQIVELVTFKPRTDGGLLPVGYVSRLTVREGWGGKIYAASIEHGVKEFEDCKDKDGLYHHTLRELRRAIEKEVTNQCFAPLG